MPFKRYSKEPSSLDSPCITARHGNFAFNTALIAQLPRFDERIMRCDVHVDVDEQRAAFEMGLANGSFKMTRDGVGARGRSIACPKLLREFPWMRPGRYPAYFDEAIRAWVVDFSMRAPAEDGTVHEDDLDGDNAVWWSSSIPAPSPRPASPRRRPAPRG